MELNISLAAEKIGQIGPLTVTNSLLATWIVMFILCLLAFSVRVSLVVVPNRWQSFIELVIGGLYGLFDSVVGENAKKFFPLVATLFIFILVANWFGLFPGFGSVGFIEHLHGKEEFIPLLRGATADLNTTLALALIAVAAIQYYGLRTLGSVYIHRFLNFSNPMNFFVGLLETVLEAAKIISFAFRLFGNIFAGEVLLTVVAFLIPFFVPLPFLFLEVFVGLIQALVFSMLTAVFLSLATTAEH